MSLSENLTSAYLNDGFIYCILTKLKHNNIPLVKIGKIGMKVNEDEDIVNQKLISRYNTYYPGYYIIHFQRSGNHHLAEKFVFENLKSIHHSKEMYYFDEYRIQYAFKNAQDLYPSVEKLLQTCYDLDILNRTNRDIREIKKSP
jgi:hypothetical protein